MLSLIRNFPIKHFSNITTRNKSISHKEKSKNYVIVHPTVDDFDDIIRLMRRAFFPEEPTCTSIGLRPTVVFDDRTIQALTQGLSLIARCKYNGDILGAAVNESANCWDPDISDKLACQVADAKSRQVIHFFAHIQRAPDLWRKYNVHKIFEIAFLFVRKDQRKKGLALHLAEESRKLAADCGFHLVRLDATNHYSAVIAEKMKMKLVLETPYCTYVGANQRPIFNPPEPHKSVKTYIDNEPQKNSLIK